MVRLLLRSVATFVSVLSLALVLMVVALWIWSDARTRTFEYGWRGQRWEASVFRGRVVFDNKPQRVRDENEVRRAVGRWLDENEPRLGPWRDKVDVWRGGAWSLPFGVAAEIEQVTAGAPGLTPPPHAPAARRREVGVTSLRLLLAVVSVPFLIHAALGAAAWRRRRRAQRWRSTGCCGACGYDLRGSEGACPECGAGGPMAERVAPSHTLGR